MASLASFYQPPATNAPALLDSYNQSAGYATTQAGLEQSRGLRDYGNVTLPGIVNDAAARGTFFGGQVGVRADQAKQQQVDQYGDIQNTLNMKLADLRRQGILAATGISL